MDTFSVFVQACEQNQLAMTDIDFPVVTKEQQRGPFYSVAAPVRIIRLRSTGQKDPFAI